MRRRKPALSSGSCPSRPEAPFESGEALGPGRRAGPCWLCGKQGFEPALASRRTQGADTAAQRQRAGQELGGGGSTVVLGGKGKNALDCMRPRRLLGRASWEGLGTGLSVHGGGVWAEGRQAEPSARWQRGGVPTPPAPPEWKLHGTGLCWSTQNNDPEQVALKR